MRIGIDLHTMTHLMQGSRTYIYNLIRSLLEVDRSNEYVFYFPSPASLHANSLLRRSNTQLKTIAPASRYIRLPLSFPLKLAADKIDLFHCQYMAPPICPCPYVISLHDIIHETHPQFYPPRLRFFMHHLYPLSARRAAKVLTISQFSKSQIAKVYRIPEERIVVTYVGVSSEFHPVENREAIDRVCEKYGVNDRYILFVGRIEPRKNIGTLIDAYHRLKSDYNVAQKLVIVGMKDPLFADFYNCMLAKADNESVIFTGGVAQEDLPHLYNGADLFVYPSFAEGFGLPVIEAMACGTPVITSDTASLPEVVGNAGVMVPPQDLDKLTEAMYNVLSDPKMRDRMNHEGLKRARLFSWRHTAESVQQAYMELI